MVNNVIIWQKWVDPFGEDTEDSVSTDPSDHEYDDSWKYNDAPTKEPKPLAKTTKVIATPMGIIPINENTASGKIFNFWIGHTNFDITKLVGQIIEHTPGVECLDIFTRYRFRIAIGKAFNDSDVMSSIQDNVYSFLQGNDDDTIKT